MIPKELYLVSRSPQLLSEADAVQKGKSVHAYIIEGAAGIGKKSLAIALASAILCTSNEPPCFLCSACSRIIKGQHPDAHFVSEEKSIKVDTIREMLATTSITAYEGGKKIYIINNFHTATEQAQNALLKTLEEPPASVVFLLLADNIEQLLPTVRSRCRTIRLYGFSISEIKEQLQLLFPDKTNIQQVAEECGGNIGKAIELLNNEEYWNLRTLALSMLNETGSIPYLAQKLEKNKESLSGILEILEELLRVKMQNSQGTQERTIFLEQLKAVTEAQLLRKKNVNAGLIIDELAYGLAKGGVKWQR